MGARIVLFMASVVVTPSSPGHHHPIPLLLTLTSKLPVLWVHVELSLLRRREAGATGAPGWKLLEGYPTASAAGLRVC